MSRRHWRLRLYQPGFADQADFVDITDRTLKIGGVRMGVSDPGDNRAITTGTVELVCRNDDGFFFERFAASLVTDLKAWSQIDIHWERPSDLLWRRWFRGIIEPGKIKFDEKARAASITGIGPRRVMDDFDAEKGMARVFPEILTSTKTSQGSQALEITLPVETTGLVVGDEIEIVPFGDKGGKTYTIQGLYGETIETKETITDTIAANSIILCRTPFPRNVNLVELTRDAFESAGILQHDVRFTGSLLKGTEPFVQYINTAGLVGWGSLRGITEGLDGSLIRKLRLSYVPGKLVGGNQHGLLETPSVEGGFVDSGALISTSVLGGGYRDQVDHGMIDPNASAQFSTMTLERISSYFASVVDINGPIDTHDVTRRAHCVMNNTEMFELRFEQPIKDTADEAPPHDEVRFSKGLRFTVRLYRHTSPDAGVTWTEDTSFAEDAAPTIFAAIGTGVYHYRVVAIYNFEESNGGTSSSTEAQKTDGPNVLNPAGVFLTIFHDASKPIVRYDIYRTFVANSNITTTGKIGFISAPAGSQNITYEDRGWIGDGSSPPTGYFQITGANDSGVGGSGGLYRHSLEAVFGERSNVLWASVYAGNGPDDPGNFLAKITLNAADHTKILRVHPTNYSVDGCRVIVTKKPGDPSRATDVYRIDTNLGVLIHSIAGDFDGETTSPTSIAGINLAGQVIHLGTLKWNREDDAESRISFFHGDSGPLPSTSGGLYCSWFTATSDWTTDFQLREGFKVLDIFDHRFNTDTGSTALDSPILCNYWRVSVGTTSNIWVLIAVVDGHLILISDEHTGLIDYADATGMSGSEFLSSLTVPVNATFNVWWTEAGDPFGIFLSKDLVPTFDEGLRLYAKGDLGDRRSTGEVLDLEIGRMYPYSYGAVKVTGADGIEETASAFADEVRDRIRTLEYNSPHIRTFSHARAIAKSLLDYYAPRDIVTGDLLPPRRSFRLVAVDDLERGQIPMGKVEVADGEGGDFIGRVERMERTDDEISVSGFEEIDNT